MFYQLPKCPGLQSKDDICVTNWTVLPSATPVTYFKLAFVVLLDAYEVSQMYQRVGEEGKN